MAAPHAYATATPVYSMSSDAVADKLRQWMTKPVSDSQLLALVHALTLLEANGAQASQRYADVMLAVKAQVEHRRSVGVYIPAWALSVSLSSKPGAVTQSLALLSEYHATLHASPRIVSQAKTIARPCRDREGSSLRWPVSLGAGTVEAGPKYGDPAWSRSGAGIAYAGPASQDTAGVLLPATGMAEVWRGPSSVCSPLDLATLEQLHRERDAAVVKTYIQQLHEQAEAAADEATKRRLLIRAKAARLCGAQRALRRVVAEAAGVLSQRHATDMPAVTASAGEHGAALGYAAVGPTPMVGAVTSAALLARSDDVEGTADGAATGRGDGIVWRVRKRPPRQLTTLEREIARRAAEADVQQKNRRQAFLRAIVVHSRDVKDRHRHHVNIMARLAKACKTHLESFQKEKEKQASRLERARIKALHDGKYDEFKKLVETTKNKRLQHLLDQTDKYLGDIGKLVQAQQDAAMDASRALTPLELDRIKRRENKGKPRSRKKDSGTPRAVDANAVEGVAEGDLSPPSRPGSLQRSRSAQQDYYAMAHAKQEVIVSQPEMLVGGTLKTYQLAGLQWLVSLYNNNLNGILADEMGLGKTIQTIALLTYLMEVKNNNGPFLIVVPLSTISNWAHELEKWAPDIRVVVYKGTPAKRKQIHARQMASGQFNVVLTTYTFVMRDKAVLRRLKYQYIIIDEGHRMKNSHCKFSRILGQQYYSRNRILLTGTPLQNNLPELWSLLNFLLPKVFNSVENFDTWFSRPFQNFGGTAQSSELTMEENLVVINRLHQVLRPFLLRRVKSEVLGQLPGKVERVLRCELSAWQRIIYKQLQEHGQMMLDPTSGHTGTKALSNVLMHLRKICNHPYLFKEDDQFPIDDNLWRASGKIELLDRMLPKLMAGGHRVLVFSQMTRLMDIMEDFLSFRGMRYLRLDGHTTADDREQRMIQFNAPDSPYFIFLLSTRAGGLGVNLATADTVIIFDSDWNPTMDLQAQDRAHRIGQTREVQVFRLATNTVVEDRILARASNKRNMEDLVINAGKFNASSNADERRAMLEGLLEADADQADDGVLDDEAINEMMMRSEKEFELYQRMDKERTTRELKEWEDRQARGEVTGPYPGRLMTTAEVPKHIRAEDVVFDRQARREAELATYGRGNRERKRVTYTDLTDHQFEKLIGGEGDVEKFQQENLRRRAVTPARAPAPATTFSSAGYDQGVGTSISISIDAAAPDAGPGAGAGTGAGAGAGAGSVAGTPAKPQPDNDSDDDDESTHATPAPSPAPSAAGSHASPSKDSKSAPKKSAKKRPRNRRYTPGSRNDPRMKAMLKRFNRKLLPSWNQARYVDFEDDQVGPDVDMGKLFMDKPSRVHYPDYYTLIARPIGLNDIKRKIQSSRYRNRKEYERDFETLFQNAFDYNVEGSAVFKFAAAMQKAFREAVKDVPFSDSLTKRRRVEEEEDDDDDDDGNDDNTNDVPKDKDDAASVAASSTAGSVPA